jgi:class 3 adenylate cyclase
VQQVLGAGETRQVTLPISPGNYRLRAPRLEDRQGVKVPAAILAPIPGQPWLTASNGGGVNEVAITLKPDRIYLSQAVIQAGEVQITLSNQTERAQVLLWEDGRWSDDIATAVDVTALQAFRDLFSSEALRPGYTVGVQNMVVLFSDLKDSTSMYQRLGDAAAFGAVIDHFELLREAIAAHRGGVVKTIGDAVMAVFREAGDGLQAALEMQERIRQFNNGHPTYPLTLKLGLHQGPCIAVNLNDRLDYFGSSVNIAARLEGQSQGGDVVISKMMSDTASVQIVLQERGLRVEPYTASLKGFEGQYQLFRVCPYDLAEQTTEELWVDVGE